MDIWKWVWEAESAASSRGDARLAELIDNLPSYVVNDEYAKVDAIIPEAINLARQNNHKWLEIFFRHWNLQSRVLDRKQVKGMLPEVINLVDFCHQEDTQDCPQSICVIQDLAQCYAGIDYLGYAEERLAVSEETFAKIDPSWPCFGCIGSEYASALIDLGKPQEAIEQIAQLRKKAKLEGKLNGKQLFNLDEIDAFVKMENWAQAYECASTAENLGGGESFIRSKTNYLVIALSGLGRYSEAIENRLSFDEIKEGCTYFDNWSLGSYMLVKANQITNNWEIDSQLDYMSEKLKANGVIRKAIDISHRQAELALLRKQPLTVQRCIVRIQSLIEELPKDLGATNSLNDLRARAESLGENIIDWHFDNVDALLNSLDEDIEVNLAKLTSARSQFPDSEKVTIELAKTLDQLNRIAESDTVLSDFLAQQPTAANCMLNYGLSLLNQSLYSELDNLLEKQENKDTSEHYQMNWHWLQAHYADKKKDKHLSLQHLEHILALTPTAYNCLRWSAELACELEEYDKSIELWNQVINGFDDEQESHWDRMIPAVLAARWDLVRESIDILKIDYSLADTDHNSPIDLELELIRLELEDDNGEKNNYLARRTGPVTARIIVISSPYHDETQLYGNEYVFNPSPLNRLDQRDDDGYACDHEGNSTLLFPVIKQTKHVKYTAFAIDGFYPGDEIWQAFEQELPLTNAVMTVQSTQDYTLEFENEDCLAIYAFVALPDTADKRLLTQLLDKHFSALSKPLTWPELLEAVDNEEEAAKHWQLQADYNIE